MATKSANLLKCYMSKTYGQQQNISLKSSPHFSWSSMGIQRTDALGNKNNLSQLFKLELRQIDRSWALRSAPPVPHQSSTASADSRSAKWAKTAGPEQNKDDISGFLLSGGSGAVSNDKLPAHIMFEAQHHPSFHLPAAPPKLDNLEPHVMQEEK